jgi:hypothetical protein
MAFDPSLVPDNKKVRLTLNSSVISSDIADFSLAIPLDGTDPLHSAIFSEIGGSSLKLSVETGGAQCPVEVEKWDSGAGKALLHTKVPSYSSSVDTILILSYDSAQDDNTAYVGAVGSSPAQSVWDADFSAVYNMAQNPAGVAPQLLDSTVNGHHMTTYGSMSSGDLVDGAVGKAIDFDGADDYADTANIAATADWTFEAFLKPVSTISGDGIFHAGGDGIVFSNDKIGLMDASNVIRSGTSVVNNVWIHVAVTSANKVFENGVDVTASLSNNGWSLSGVTRIASGYLARKPQMILQYAAKSNVVRSADWIKLKNLSYTDQLISWSSFADPSFLRAILDQDYDLLNSLMRSILEQIYPLTAPRFNVFDQVYGLRMLVILSQLYGNSPRYRAQLSQYYGDSTLFRRMFIQSYGDASRYRQHCEQGWDMPESLRRMFEQRYSISGSGYRAMLDHVYDVSDVELLRAQLDQLYILAAGEALVQRTEQGVYCGGVEHASAYNIMIEQDESLFYMVGELQLADELEFLQYRPFDTDVVIEVDDRQYHFIVDADPRRSRQPGESVFVVPLVSKTALLDSPHSVITSDSLSGMASDLVATLAAPFTVDWQLVNWFIPPNILQSNGESAISLIRRIVAAAGGIVQTSPAGVLVCRPEYPVSVGEWSSAVPDLELTDQDDFFSIDPSPDPRPGYNVFFLTNQSLAADGVSLDIVNVSATQNELRVSMLPWSDTARVIMHHSGGSWVQVVDQGVVVETITEQVEIIAGAGQTTKPVFAYLDHEYSVVDLGAVEVAEAGNVTTALAENSLLQLTYQTRYWSFLATDRNIEDVQFFPEIIES